MLDDFPKTTPLSSELEWMLQSGQVEDNQVVEALVHHYSGELYRLAHFVLNDVNQAEQAVAEGIAQAVGSRHRYWGEYRLKVWLYHLVWKASQKLKNQSGIKRVLANLRSSPETNRPSGHPYQTFRNPPNPERSLGEFEQELKKLSPQAVQVLFLRCGYQLSVPEISRVTGLPNKSIQVDLSHARQLKDNGSKSSDCENRALVRDSLEGVIDIQGDAEARAFLEGHLGECSSCRNFAEKLKETEMSFRQSMQTLWPLPGLSEAASTAAYQSVIHRLNKKGASLRLSLSVKEFALGAMVIVAVLLFGWYNNWTEGNRNPASLAGQARQRSSLPTPPAQALEPGSGAENQIAGQGPNLAGSTPSPTETAQTRLEIPVEAMGADVPQQSLGWNNSGPVYLARALNYWGWRGSLHDILVKLQPNLLDENVQPYELVNYVMDDTDYHALVRIGGDVAILKSLIDAGFPVLIQSAYFGGDRSYNSEWGGRYDIVTGYDDSNQRILMQGTFLDVSAETSIRYPRLDRVWRPFNYSYLVIYPSEKEAQLMQVLGIQADVTANLKLAAQKSTYEVQVTQGIDRFFSWFNLGTSLVNLQDYFGAAEAYDQAFKEYGLQPRNFTPWRIVWYQTRVYWAYYYTGRYADVIRLADGILSTFDEPILEESYYWRALAKEAQGDLDGAIEDLRESVRLNPNFYAGLYQLERIKGGT